MGVLKALSKVVGKMVEIWVEDFIFTVKLILFSYKKKREITLRHSPISKITPSYKSLYNYQF
jgi:hypothetical protein